MDLDPATDFILEFLSPRQYHTCPQGLQWYVCSGKYTGSGCCSNDPCTDGYCYQNSASVTTAAPTSTPSPVPSSTDSVVGTIIPMSSSEIASSTVTPEVGPPVSTSAPPPSTSSTSSDTSIASTVSATPTTSSTSGTSTSSSLSTATTVPVPTHGRSSNKGAIIGGAVGGVAAVALCLFLFWFCWRRRKRQQSLANANLHRSVSSEFLEEGKGGDTVNPNPGTPGSQAYFLDGKDSLRSLPNRTPSTNTTTTTSRPESWNPSLHGFTNGPSEASTFTSISNNNMDPLPETNELPASIPQRAGFTPELPDTGVYSTRAELAATNQSELINQRQRRVPTVLRPGYQSQQSKATSRFWDASPSPALVLSSSPQPSLNDSPTGRKASPVVMSRQSARQVVTPEGVVLGANLDRYDAPRDEEDTEEGEGARGGQRNAQGHIMSFMSYENDAAARPSDQEAGGGDGADGVKGTPRIEIDEPGETDVQEMEGGVKDGSSPQSDVPPAI